MMAWLDIRPRTCRMRRTCIAVVLLAASGALFAQQAPQPPASPITDHFAARVSYYRGSVSTTGSVTDPNSPTPGTPISLEDDLGLTDKVHQGRVEFIFRMRERHRLRVDMWELDRDAVSSPTSTIVFGDVTLLPTDMVSSNFDWRQTDFTYTYSVLHKQRFELGVGLGFHLIQASTEARVYARGVHETFDGAGPFATVALDGSFLITDRFSFNARAQYMSLHLHDTQGKLGDYHADLQFRWKPNLAFGLGYQATNEQITVSNANPYGDMQFNVRGAELFVRASF
jgi:hypothetical protein